uniref:Uncharacterized protein n=1 Tax=Rhizophora mucronata TaxID=61149 RepID=A0A2P2M2I7_RHIMU
MYISVSIAWRKHSLGRYYARAGDEKFNTEDQ